MSRSMLRLAIAAILVLPSMASAQEGPQQAQTPQDQARPTGLPAGMNATFNFDAGWGTFGFANSLYDNPKERGVDEDLSDQWFEGYVKPAVSFNFGFASSSELYGKASVVGERTYGSVPVAFGEDISSFGAEDLYVGWRSGKALTLGENALDFVVGRTQYRLGHGFLLWDGSAEGGSRGGYWTNGRKAFEFAAIGRFKPGPHTVEAFYLDKDELPESDSGSRVTGANYELSIGEATTLGATYMRWFAHEDLQPGRDGLDVYNVRAYTAPFPTPAISFEAEYAAERNGEALESDAWTAQASYEFMDAAWKPKLTYRYAIFEGDDPDTSANEAFDPLFLGFHDWGTWWQGEIAGEYFLSNSNLASHLFRVHLAPRDFISGGVMLFNFRFDQPASVGPGVTSRNAALEIDAYADWKLNANFTLSFVAAFADPDEGVEQASGRTKNFGYGMVYVAYSY